MCCHHPPAVFQKSLNSILSYFLISRYVAELDKNRHIWITFVGRDTFDGGPQTRSLSIHDASESWRESAGRAAASPLLFPENAANLLFQGIDQSTTRVAAGSGSSIDVVQKERDVLEEFE